MNGRNLILIGIGTALALAVAFILLVPTAMADNDPLPSGGTVTGDWVVTDSRSYNSVTINVQDGNLIIQSGGTLSLNTVTLRFWKTNPSGDNYTFDVQSGGTLNADAGCYITSMSSSYHYVFCINGSATINGSTLAEMWGSVDDWPGGVQIRSDSVSITNCTVTNGMTGGISIFNSSPTISLNRITGNGQDGQCATFCFGLYAWNTKSNISSNQIYANNYATPLWTDPRSYTSVDPYPQTAGYYKAYFNGRYFRYSGYPRYGYYYYYEYLWQKQTIYGTGVVIQGNSDATFYNNSVYRNGYKAPSPSYQSGSSYYYYYYYAYCSGPYYGYYYFYRLIQYSYTYRYFAWTNYGTGLSIDNSTVEISGCTFDRNGLDPYYPSTVNDDTAHFYWGVAINMTNSQGNITGNTIKNSCTLVNLTNCRANLTANTMLGDYFGTAPDSVSGISGGMITDRAVWGVRANNTVISSIINNTLTMQYKSYPYHYVRGQNRNFANSVVGMELGTLSVPLNMSGNKLLVDDENWGICAASVVLMDLRANLTFIGNTVEYRRPNLSQSGTPNCYLLTPGNANTVTIENCAFKGPTGGGVSSLPSPAKATGPTIYGIYSSYNTAITFKNSTMTGCDYGIQAHLACRLTIQKSAFTNNGAAIQAMYATKTQLTEVTFTSAQFGLQAAYATKNELYNITFKTCGYGVQLTDYSKATLNTVTMTGNTICDISAEGISQVTVEFSNLANNMRGVQAFGSSVLIGNSTLSHPSEFLVDMGSIVDLFNTPHTRAAVLMLDNDSYVTAYWPVQIKVFWQDETPVAGASVSVYTMTGERVFSSNTNEEGSPAPLMWLKDYMVHNMMTTSYSPYRMTASKGRASSMDLFFVDQPVTVIFHLVDQIPPELTVLRPPDGQLFNRHNITIRGLASDPEAGLKDGIVRLNVDNLGWEDVPVTDGAWQVVKLLDDGPHIIRVMTEDLVNNVARVSVQISIDTVAPVLYVFTPVNDSSINQRTVRVTGVSEEGAFVTVNGISVPLTKRSFGTPISLDEGANIITVSAMDLSGNIRTVVVHVNLDTLPPLLEVTSPLPDSYTNQNPISVMGTTEPSAIVKVNGVPAPVTGSGFEALVGLSEGANSLSVMATDLAGNVAFKTVIVILDTIPPDLTVFTPRDGLWTNQSRVLVSGATESTATVTVNGQYVNVENTVFSTYITLLEGANNIELTAKGLAGNRKTVTRTVYLDTRPPDLVVTSPLDHSHSAVNVIRVAGSVDFGAEVRVNGERTGVTDFVFSTTLRFDADGTQVVEVTARDLAGNGAIVTRTVDIDTTQPVVTISYPVDNTKVRLRMIMVSGQTEPGATIVVNTETVVKVGSDGLFSVPVVLEDGTNRITVRAFDDAGNTATSAVTVTKPVAKVKAAADNSWMLNMTGVLIGVGIALPLATYLITESNRRHHAKTLAEVEADEAARKEREAAEARRAALPTVERVGKKRVRVVAKEPAPPPPPPEPPKMEAPPAPEPPAAPELSKAGLKDKSGAQEVSPDDTEQANIPAPKSPSAVGAPEAPAAPPDASLKDKGTEAEGAAGETELSGDVRKKQ